MKSRYVQTLESAAQTLHFLRRAYSISIQSRETEQIDVHSLSYFGKKNIILIILSVAVQSC